MRFEGECCSLRSWQEADVAVLPSIADDPGVARYMRLAFPQPYTVADASAWVARNAHDRATDVAITVGGALAGGVGLTLGFDVDRGSAEVGYWLGRAFWGRGIATAAVTAFSDYAFARYPLHRLWAGVMASNHASMRVLEKSGYVREAVLRAALIDRTGHIEDCHLFTRGKPATAAAGSARQAPVS